ncbi:DEAD/DEAH box helicase [Pseudoalteromonas sp. A601]|uniref:DEAD/DEAH box helicase n=1 Tax=Pseudoalteromonas sp. A601 TaxID=1967839 RepID=UPI000B3CAF1A|nr:DEAD/DEAH box helicase family protein [Pseudoalteromonas sp. A601]OUS71004.1 DEAD/DEAH box helicase [Pseudoalteromonas sp. A601]
MKLRKWQAECIELALTKYINGARHFLALATPGSGKTVMASELANQLLKNNLIDLVICFSPSTLVAKDFAESLQEITQMQFDGKMGAKGNSLTYQNLQYFDDSFWQLFNRFRVFVIFDEIHHCAGSNLGNSNAWGEQIILNIQNKAKYTLALTGTPWRSDEAPIALSSYVQSTNKISCDYIYGLSDALRDNVCRIPQIIAVDNSNISVVNGDETKTFSSFKSLLSQSTVPYKHIINNENVIKYIIYSAHKKLKSIRTFNPDAAGFIVASSVDHATKIAAVMQACFNEKSVVVTYRESNSMGIIQQFRHSASRWIISVGMISEGTNIPRLQICCHLTNIKTEMHFRQVLGRILRITDSTNQEAIMYVPAEPKLLEYIYRVKQDVPFEADVVKFETMKPEVNNDTKDGVVTILSSDIRMGILETPPKLIALNADDITFEQPKEVPEKHLTTSYEQVVNIFGRFKQEAIALGLIELR